MKLKIDCRYYKNSYPCSFHKLDGRICDSCQDYSSVKQTILIVKTGSLGDVLRTTSILPAIKKAYPHSFITWLTKEQAVPLLTNNNFLDAILTIEGNYLEYILSREFDIAISLDLEPLSAAINTLCKAAKKKGFITDKKGIVIPADKNAKQWHQMSMNDALKRNNRNSYFEHMYNICLLELPYYPPQYILDRNQQAFAIQFKKTHRLSEFSKIIGINTGGGGRWQLKRWELATM